MTSVSRRSAVARRGTRRGERGGCAPLSCSVRLSKTVHYLAECGHLAALGTFVNDWLVRPPDCAAGHRGRPAPEQKSRQRIEFTSMGRIDPAAGSREPQVKALSSRRLLRVHPKIRSFGRTFAWHRARRGSFAMSGRREQALGWAYRVLSASIQAIAARYASMPAGLVTSRSKS